MVRYTAFRLIRHKNKVGHRLDPELVAQVSHIEHQFSDDAMQSIPTLARVAFAARCARLTMPRFRHAWHDVPDNIYRLVEFCLRSAESVGEGNGPGPTVQCVGSVIRLAEDLEPHLPRAAAVAFTVHAAAMTAYFASYCSSIAASHIQAAVAASTALQAVSGDPKLKQQLQHDYDSLRRATETEKWDYTKCVPPSFFTYHPEFDISALTRSRTKITPSASIDAALIQGLRSEPYDIYDLTPQQFEALIAELFTGFGFDVTLTAASGDGGRDVIAQKNGETRLRYLIECKKYARNRKVGVRFVRQLHGVVANERGTKGILATTSTFTKPARKFMSENEWILEGRDFDGIQEWMARYSADLDVLFRARN